MEETQEDLNLQTKESRVSKNEEKMKKFLELLHSQSKKWRPYNQNVLCWSFLCVNDNGKMTLDAP
jgi:fructose-1,6-bisphosphatase